jgi:hypothetical protein
MSCLFLSKIYEFMPLMLARQADIDSIIHAQGSAVRRTTALSPGHGPSSFHRPHMITVGPLGKEAGLSADSVTGHIFAGVSKHGPGIYLGQYLATCKHRMQAMPSPTSGMLCGALVAIVLVLRQDCYCLSALYGTGGGVYLTGLAWMLL